jgi:di/tripeptidase
LIESAQSKAIMDARVGENQHKVSAFAKAVDELKAQSDYEETLVSQHVKFPFKAARDFYTDDGLGWELQVYAHDDKELNES